jgi:hypothetical protein
LLFSARFCAGRPPDHTTDDDIQRHQIDGKRGDVSAFAPPLVAQALAERFARG